jgi:serine protease Do
MTGKIRGALLALALLAAPGAARAHELIDVSDLVAKLLPSVVSISAIRVTDTPAQEGKAATTERHSSIGTGFVIDPQGLIVTNKHVVAGASEVTVTFSNGTKLAANILSMAIVDIALLQVQPDKPLPAVKWGDSSQVKQGQPVIVIGSPLGYTFSVTAGIVSALERDISTSPVDDYIQTDAPINQGNSGGPLFNVEGQVVGVNTALQSRGNGGSIGIGFSIPSNDARFVVQRLLKYGRVKPGWVGLRVQALTPMLAEGVGLPRAERHAQGVIVTGLEPGASAEAHIRPGDVIFGVNDSTMRDARTYNRAVGVLDVGSTATFDVWRAGKRMAVEVKVVDWPDDVKAGQGKTPSEMAASFTDPPDLGLGLSPITPDVRSRYKIAQDIAGVAVVAVDAHSKASEVGIEPGDVILRVQTQTVSTAREFWQQVDAARMERRIRLLLLVRGPSGERWVTLPSA